MKAKKKRVKKATMMPSYYWPGPTRLYDPHVDCGAVLMCGEHAKALVLAVADALRHGGHDEVMRDRMVTAAGILNATFRLGIEQAGEPLEPGTMVTWAGSRWKVVEWQPENGIGGAYWLRNRRGEDAVAGPEEIE